MSKPQYRHAHKQERKRWAPIVEAGQAYCAEPRCVVAETGGTRWIPPGSPWHLCHDAKTGQWIGPGHARCNHAENARRNNPKRAAKVRRWVL